MNPKDITKEQVIIGLSDALRVEINRSNNPDDRVYALNYRQAMESELLRRLDEADALRKENDALRKALSGLLANALEDGDTRLAVQKARNIVAKHDESEASHE